MTTCSPAHSVAKPHSSAEEATASITARSAPAPIPNACNPSCIARSSHAEIQLPLSNFAKTSAWLPSRSRVAVTKVTTPRPASLRSSSSAVLPVSSAS